MKGKPITFADSVAYKLLETALSHVYGREMFIVQGDFERRLEKGMDTNYAMNIVGLAQAKVSLQDGLLSTSFTFFCAVPQTLPEEGTRVELHSSRGQFVGQVAVRYTRRGGIKFFVKT